MRLAGEGDTGLHGGPPGHLYAYVTVEAHPLFERDEENVVYELKLNPTLDGDDSSLKVPAGTQTGRIFTLKGKGVTRLHANGRGDLLVRANVVVPTELTDEQRDLLKKLAESFGTPVSDKGLLGKIKDALS